MFTLNFKAEIRGKLQGDIVSSDFDVGYVSGNSVISIHNPDNLGQMSRKETTEGQCWLTKQKQATDYDIEETDKEEEVC